MLKFKGGSLNQTKHRYFQVELVPQRKQWPAVDLSSLPRRRMQHRQSEYWLF